MQMIEQHKLTPDQVKVILKAVNKGFNDGIFEIDELSAADDLVEVLTSRTPGAELRVMIEYVEGPPHRFPVPSEDGRFNNPEDPKEHRGAATPE